MPFPTPNVLAERSALEQHAEVRRPATGHTSKERDEDLSLDEGLGLGIVCDQCTGQSADDGVMLWTFSSYPRVLSLMEDGPAATAGIRVGDLLLRINGADLVETDSHRLRFPPSSSVTAVVFREGRRIEVRLTLVSRREGGSQ